MTVQELIAELQKLPKHMQDVPVFVHSTRAVGLDVLGNVAVIEAYRREYSGYADMYEHRIDPMLQPPGVKGVLVES